MTISRIGYGFVLLSVSVLFLTMTGCNTQVEVPDVVGLPKAEAESKLTSAGLKVGPQTQAFNAEVTRDYIISQRPEAGTTVDKETAVALDVSKGAFASERPTFVPATGTESVELEPGFSVEAAKDELLISCDIDITREQLQAVFETLEEMGLTIVGEAPESRVLQVRIPATESESQIIDQISDLPGVVDVGPNMLVEEEGTPQDNYTMFMRYLESVGIVTHNAWLDSPPPEPSTKPAKLDPEPDNFDGDYWIDQINAREAWDVSTGDSGAVIAVVDSNLDEDQTVVSEDRVTRFDWQGNPIDDDDAGSQTHGVNVTNLAASDGAEDDDAVGVCWECDIIFVDWNTRTLGKGLTTGLISAIENAVSENNASVVNVSAGPVLSRNSAATSENLLRVRQQWRLRQTNAIITARRNNALVVFSAGNDGDGRDRYHGNSETTVYNDDQLLPEEDDERQNNWLSNTLIVAATTESALDEDAPVDYDTLPAAGSSCDDGNEAKMAYFSRRGDVVNIAAPGFCVGFGSGDTGSGTSYAAPLVTGTAGLISAINPDLAAIEVRQFILDSANPDPLSGASVGAGLLDLHAAAELAEASKSIPLRDEVISVEFSPDGPDEISRDLEVTLPGRSGVRAMDVLFLVDTSGSYDDDIETFKTVAYDILNDLSELADDVQFGVASFADFPLGSYGSPEAGDEAFVLDQRITDSNDLVVDAINMLNEPLNYGVDGPESQLEALWQAATGSGRDINEDGDYQDEGEIRPTNVGWRPGALRVIILATDASFHDSDEEPAYPGAGFATVLSKLQETGTVVIGLDSGYTSGDLERVVEATNGLMFELASDSSGMGEAIWTGVSETVRSVELTLTIVGDPEEFIERSSLETFSDVEAGETRTFSLSFQNTSQVPVRDIEYELRIWVRSNGSAILERVPVVVAVKAK